MSLDALPPELFVQVLEFLGPLYFREDVRRLTVSKQWFACALGVLYTDLELSQTSLRQLLLSPSTETTLGLVRNNIRSLSLGLKGFEGWRDAQDTSDEDSSSLASWESPPRSPFLAEWTDRLNDDLNQLATTIKDAPNLRNIHIHAASERDPSILDLPRRDYLSVSTIWRLLDVENINLLDLDTWGTTLVPSEDHGDFHICEVIGNLLPRLQSLRLRLRNICADALRPQTSGMIRLSKLVINLSWPVKLRVSDDGSYTVMAAADSSPCRDIAGGFLELNPDIEKQAKNLVGQMEYPQTFKLLAYLPIDTTGGFLEPEIKWRSFDVLTGKRMVLTDDSEWEYTAPTTFLV